MSRLFWGLQGMKGFHRFQSFVTRRSRSYPNLVAAANLRTQWFSDKPKQNEWSYYWTAGWFAAAFTGTGCIISGVAAVLMWQQKNFAREQILFLQNQVRHNHDEHTKLSKEERDELFRIKDPGAMVFERAPEVEQWETFVETALERFAIKWVYGDKALGKSTILRTVAWNLHQKWKQQQSKTQLFYVDLEYDENDIKQLLANLKAAIKENARNGIKSCIIFDSVGKLVTQKPGYKVDCTLEEFAKTTEASCPEVRNWFLFVKSSYDHKEASYVFLTSKPMHYAIKTPIAGDIERRASEHDAYDDAELGLKLKQKDAIAFVEQQCKNKKKAEKIVADIKAMNEKEFDASDYWNIGALDKMV